MHDPVLLDVTFLIWSAVHIKAGNLFDVINSQVSI
jgi:hypothetical protein